MRKIIIDVRVKGNHSRGAGIPLQGGKCRAKKSPQCGDGVAVLVHTAIQ